MGGTWRDDHPDNIQAVHWWCISEKAQPELRIKVLEAFGFDSSNGNSMNDSHITQLDLQAMAEQIMLEHGFEPEFPAAVQQQLADIKARSPLAPVSPKDVRDLPGCSGRRLITTHRATWIRLRWRSGSRMAMSK
jgi:hypothetical protein